MRPKTSVKLSEAEFDRIKVRAKNLNELKKQRHIGPDDWATKVPFQVGIKMNNTCNLRCSHCFEWNDDGYHHAMDKEQRRDEVDLVLIERLLKQTEQSKSSFYLWGGEPLMYTKMEQLTDLFVQYPRWVTICTNGMLTMRHLTHLLKISENLAMLISLDGLEPENDAIRGKGVFNKVIAAIKHLLMLRQSNEYLGKVSICLTLNDGVIGKLGDFIQFFADLGVDSVYIVFPWYMPENVATDMDAWVTENLPHRAKHIKDFSQASWHGYTHHLSIAKTPELKREIQEITERTWSCRVRFHPDLQMDEIDDFVQGKPIPAEGKSSCAAITNRIDVLPGGSVSSCKFFPELEVGNIQALRLDDVWHGPAFQEFRKKIRCGLMPVCSKCTLLYSTG
ncbi:radical SAM protein [Paraglaciecola sp.]|uniref:radical SAM protein n=1 Tax=Paraglaciecola sp. TaxID=1920173 RepID=UPI0030F39FCB